MKCILSNGGSKWFSDELGFDFTTRPSSDRHVGKFAMTGNDAGTYDTTPHKNIPISYLNFWQGALG